MGKYMRKFKLTGEVAVMDVSQSPLGVRTRAKTLALQRLQSVSQPPKPDSCYLELRSRRLEKPPLFRPNSQKTPTSRKQGSVGGGKEAGISPQKPRSDTGLSIGIAVEEDSCMERQSRGFEMEDLEIEASFGENVLDSEPRERGTRESTPCSLIKVADNTTPPGSSTKRTSQSDTNQGARNMARRNVPTPLELDEFFADAEKLQRHRFIEKYNFDIVNDVPLPGRYEWVKGMP